MVFQFIHIHTVMSVHIPSFTLALTGGTVDGRSSVQSYTVKERKKMQMDMPVQQKIHETLPVFVENKNLINK